MPYTTRARLERFFKVNRVAAFLDRDDDGTDDSVDGVSIVDDVIERAGNELDVRFAKAYPVPFAATVTDTPPIVRDLCDKLAAAMLVEVEYPDSAWPTKWREQIDDRVDAILAGDEDIPNVSRLGADEGRTFFAYHASLPRVSGSVESADAADDSTPRGFL